ncbi:MAG: ammonium transporter [Anaerolineae bacterium]|nr:ammonium transporter [Phycisphaerae bacterium]
MRASSAGHGSRTHHRFFLVFGLFSVLFLTSPAFAAPVAPVEMKDVKDVSAGDTAWMLTCAALVLMMTGPALALFYGGLVRRKNVLATMMQSFMLMAIVSVLWAIVGYSLAFDVGNPFIGGLRFAFLRGVGSAPVEYAGTIPHTTFMVYQLMFAIITPALICGAYAERMKFSAMAIFSSLWLLVVYCPMAHMVWGKGGLFNAFLPGDLNIPALDFAGGTVVHISSGISALVCALVLGKRVGFGKTPMPPHSVVISVIGAALLWVGWFGFNGGSALAAGGLASNAFVATHFAAAAGALGWVIVEWIRTKHPTVLGAISGAVAGLVVITPASGFTTPMWGMLMGLIGGIACYLASTSLKRALGYDDSLDAFGVHGVGGTVGAVLTGVFAVAEINGKSGLIEGNGRQLLNQLIATGATIVFATIGAYVLLKLTQLIVGLRVTAEEESLGLDLTQHGEAGYNFDDAASGPLVPESAVAVARFPSDGAKRYSVIVEGTEHRDLAQAWSTVCDPAGQPTPEFKRVYPFMTTVSGNRFHFRGGEPEVIRQNIDRLLRSNLHSDALRNFRTRVDAPATIV